MSYPIKQGQTAQPLTFLLILSSDHLSPAAGKTPTVTLSKDGAAFASPTGAVSEIGDGWYKVAGNATDAATLGPLILHATEASSDPTDALFQVVAYDPQLTSLGLVLANLDAAVSTRSTYAGGDTSGTTTLLSRIPGTIPANGSGFTAIGDARLASLDAAVSSRSTYAGGPVASVTAGVTLANGAISSPTFAVGTVNAAATGILERLLLFIGSFFPLSGGSVTAPKSGNGSIVVKTTGGATIATQTVSDDGTIQTRQAAS